MSENTIETVTVSVLTYNSSRYVIETLESIKAQTYPNLILQICDDCSTDNTIRVCQQWIDKNRSRFVKSKLITSEHNTGVSGNSNRSWDACETIYIKEIAGDDKLLPNCIDDNMQFIEEHPDAVFVFSRIKILGNDVEWNKKIEKMFDYSCFSLTSDQQLDWFLRCCNFVPASTCFANISKIREHNIRNDERIPLLEDIPKWINALWKGITLYFFDKETVEYRVHESSLSTCHKQNVLFRQSLEMFFMLYTYPYIYSVDREHAMALLYGKVSDLWRYKNMVQKNIFYRIYVRMRLWGGRVKRMIIRKLG